MARLHQPVLVHEVVRLLSGKAVVIDATVGTGGHAEALLEAGAGAVLGLDRDEAALAEARSRLRRFGGRFRAVRARFSRLAEAAREVGVERCGGVLFDLGVSSLQLESAERGFSYRLPGPLDMRMGDEGPTAAEVVNTYPEERLARVLQDYGEERFARRIARAIVRARARAPIARTDQLAAVVAAAVPRRRGGPHPARRTFQALRIEVNRELEELTASLPQAVGLLEPGGRLVVISYHSLEDRVVKRFMAGEARLLVLTRRPVVPTPEERARNPRSRSAKLRAAERREGEVR
ncbi:MAG TPA: 16S rRNA (cytosine(1402)-N(4))-methyltransferase RsmH [Actinomycetota bacterium]|nr:16S rRNA (cytosine(1402)-N(4))-methyltransferase RsmH [Actinomycetota bacterium]